MEGTSEGRRVGDVPEITSEGRRSALRPLCHIAYCDHYGEHEVVFEQTVRWASGRTLEGAIVRKVLVCDEHLEALVQGKDVHTHDRA